MKRLFLFLWRLPKKIFYKINECEENFLQKFNPEYKSKLAMNALIYHFAAMVVNFLTSLLCFGVLAPIFMEKGIDENFLFVISSLLSLALPVIYITLYLKKRLPFIQGRKWWYCLQVILGFLFGGLVILAPIYILIGLIIISFYIVVALICLWLGFSVLFPEGKRRWRLDNGDEVTEEKGICGESYYRGSSGKEYRTDNDGDTFYEK